MNPEIVPFDEAHRIVQEWRLRSLWTMCIPRAFFGHLEYEIARSLAKLNQNIDMILHPEHDPQRSRR